MQISFTGGFLANGGILKISQPEVNSKRDLNVIFAMSGNNIHFQPYKT